MLVSTLPLAAEFTVDDPGRFAVNLPEPVKRDSNDVDTKIGKVRMFTLTHESNEAAFIIAYGDYPAGSLSKTDRATTYDNFIEGVVQNLKGVLRSGAEHRLARIAGREWIIDMAKDKLVARERCYIVGDRLNQIMFLGPAGAENGAAVFSFMNSFRLLR